MTETLEQRMEQYGMLASRLLAEYYNENNEWLLPYVPPTVTVTHRFTCGPKYAKLILQHDFHYHGEETHTYIALANGDILKADGRRPAKNGVRGNIWADDLGLSVINWHGAKYLRN